MFNFIFLTFKGGGVARSGGFGGGGRIGEGGGVEGGGELGGFLGGGVAGGGPEIVSTPLNFTLLKEHLYMYIHL